MQMHIGLQIKLARIAKGLTQQELAERIFKTRPLVSHIEQRGEVNEKTLADIRKILDMSEQNNPVSKDSVGYDANVQQKFLQQEVEHLLREIELLKSENEVLRQLADTQKQLIERLKG
ncbi:MAG: helix-turn-helix domain-containing protein [Sphingobacteriales bacterium]|nr:helix-turn-helix domain-containing protein [Sphingobacteriales bacterium]